MKIFLDDIFLKIESALVEKNFVHSNFAKIDRNLNGSDNRQIGLAWSFRVQISTNVFPKLILISFVTQIR